MELHAIMLSIVGLDSVTSICHHSGEIHQSDSIGSFWRIPITYTVFRWDPLTGFHKFRSDGYDMFASDVVRKYLLLENRRNPPGQMKLDSIEFGKMVIFNMEYDTVHSNIEGYGIDNVGEFILNRIFSKETNQIDIVQSYKVCFIDIFECFKIHNLYIFLS